MSELAELRSDVGHDVPPRPRGVRRPVLFAFGATLLVLVLQTLLGLAQRSDPDHGSTFWLDPWWGSWVWGLGLVGLFAVLVLCQKVGKSHPARQAVAVAALSPVVYVLPFMVALLWSAGRDGSSVGDGVWLAVVFPFFSINGWFAVAVGVAFAFRLTVLQDYRAPRTIEDEDEIFRTPGL